jgi:pyruvate dehydrogenase E2 component (dihydrolipoamide acetyltransferase)
MARPITMPKLGQSEEQVTLARWLKKEGDSVLKGDVLFEIETDKSLLEVETFYQGTLLKILVAEGETVPVQTIVGFVGDPGDPIPEVGDPGARTLRLGREQFAKVQTSAQPAPPPNASSLFRISPRAASLAKEAAIDPTLLVGTGPGGRVVERDVKAYLDAKGRHPAVTPTASQPAAQPSTDILTVRKPAGSEETGASPVRDAMAGTTIPMSRMRQVIAARLTASFTTTPHFFLTVSADMTDLLQLRSELNAQGMSYTVTDFIAVATVLSLKEFTAVNSTTDGKNLYRHNKVHLGLAVSLDDGVVVPVIRDGDELTLSEIHQRAAALVAKARAGSLTPDEMT